MTETPATSRNEVSIVRVWSSEDFGAAKGLLARYRLWLENILGGDLAVAQPSAARELTDLERFYEPPNGRLLLARAGGEPIGVVGVHCLDGSGVGEMKRLYVAPEARGLGAGRALVSAAIAAAEDLGFHVLRLETHAGYMPEAVAMYRKLGFRETNPYHSVVGVEGVMTMELWLRREEWRSGGNGGVGKTNTTPPLLHLLDSSASEASIGL